MTFALKGRTGTLRAGGRPALVFEAFEFATRDPSMGGGWQLDARVVTKDDYWLGRDAPMELRLDLTNSRWRFRDVPREAVVFDGDAVTITHHGDPEDA
jgi:hypothetical protein